MSNDHWATSTEAVSSEPYAGSASQPGFQRLSAETLVADQRLYRLFLLIGDALVLFLAFTAAYWLRFQVGVTLVSDAVPSAGAYLSITLELIAMWLVIFALMGLYDFHNLLGGTLEYMRVANACVVGAMMVVLISFVNPGFIVARAWLVLAWILSTAMVIGYRLLMRRLAYRARASGYFIIPTIIIGANAEAVALANQFKDKVSSGVHVVGFVDPAHHEGEWSAESTTHDFPVLGPLSNVIEIVLRSAAREVIVVPSALNGEQLVGISQTLAALPQVDMRLSSGLYEVFTTGMRVTTRNSVPLMSLNRLRLTTVEAGLKAMLDYGLVLVALPLLLPIFLVIYALVKFDSPGPVFYRRRVMGVGSQEFDAFKFRTMYVNGASLLAADPEKLALLQRDHKLKDDPRITKIGKLLRRTSLDELPQLINVLLGQMSLVGPRMISPAEGEKYGRMKANLLTVKPGLTGLWQVSGRSNLSYDDRVRLDMYYVRNYSIWLDVQILFFQTLPAVLKGRGAF